MFIMWNSNILETHDVEEWKGFLSYLQSLISLKKDLKQNMAWCQNWIKLREGSRVFLMLVHVLSLSEIV